MKISETRSYGIETRGLHLAVFSGDEHETPYARITKASDAIYTPEGLYTLAEAILKTREILVKEIDRAK